MAPKAVLIGLPGSGKSTIGRRLAKATGCSLIDTDTAIEERTGRTIPEIFATEGESGFRQIEEQVVCEALRDHDGILSLGGGAITIPRVREALAGHTVVYLEISASEGVRRTSGSTASRSRSTPMVSRSCSRRRCSTPTPSNTPPARTGCASTATRRCRC